LKIKKNKKPALAAKEEKMTNIKLKGNRCPTCNGRGTIIKNPFEVDCPKCNGTGLVNIANACKKCGGSGSIILPELAMETDCPRCNGTGLEPLK